jgi:hypothetical protein
MEDHVFEQRWKVLRVIVLAMLVGAPVAYVVVVYLVSKYSQVGGEPPQVFLYVLYALALIGPISSKFLKSAYLAGMRRSSPTSDNVFNRYNGLVIIRSAKIESTYIFGLIWFFLSGQITPLYYFYAIGIFWSIILWPSKQEYQDFVQEAQAP